MGYMTVVSILNDAWHDMEENPKQFMANIKKGMHDYDTSKVINHYPVAGYCNPMEVHRSFHANQSNLLLVGGNHMENVGVLDPNRTDDFYLAYKVRVMQEAEEKIEHAKVSLYFAIANSIENAMKNQGKSLNDVYEVANATESFMALTDKEQATVIQMISKSFKPSENEKAFK